MNNNRQAGRRRGRGGQRQGGGNPNSGNRIDNRARGNASQLLEKYKTLAADAQRQGDRVNAEYYLQFADHYFRVLAESRSRFEEQNPNQNQRRGREDAFDDEDEGFDEDGNEIAAEAEQPRRQQQSRDDRGPDGRGDNGRNQDGQREYRGRDRNDRGDREQREDRGNRGNGNYAGNGYAANDGDEDNRPEVAAAPEGDREPARRPRARREAKPVAANEGETFDAALLPPSLGIGIGDEGEEAPKPRRGRPRRTPGAEAAE
ncbi:DUF4167 domain-containing protein [Sphingomonas panacisoli]|uniref:DUF4167 domain-containing protein n=1 Tax=Sphingomonas panacisoli TaxID=1813879 RepID=A0A5B8LP96_9SPHN|nr:DUF4167 domain-containing protein [Sphingomonas panacisoli]QDZ09222.1 DUF4167 domain-containing protein [Sphingomonas panacisoli]